MAEIPTLITYVAGDAAAAQLISDKFGIPAVQAGNVTESELAHINVIVVGGYFSNPWSSVFFPHVWDAYDYDNGLFPSGWPGVSEDRKYIVTAVERPNGTWVVLVAGHLAEDTYRAAEKYVKGDGFPWELLAIPIAGLFIYWLASREKKRKKD